jgi:biopolymer transport protein ExbB
MTMFFHDNSGLRFEQKLRRFACGLLIGVGSLAAHAQSNAETAGVVGTMATGVSQSVVENPYGLSALWAQGDFVARGTLLILVLMSVASWYILVTRLAASLKLSAEARAVRQSFFKAPTLQAGVATLGAGSAFRYIAEAGINAREHHEGALTEHIDRNTWITMSVQRSVDEVQSRLQGGLAILATVGSTAPFIGLFGTVWGIYNALTAIGIAGQASIDKVAGPVGEALIMTAIGLAVAVPAVLGYNALVRRNKLTMDAVRGFAADLHGILLGANNLR